jgi:hypothetical protein
VAAASAWLGLAIALYWLIPNIERRIALSRLPWGMHFIAGMGRLLSMFFLALPPIPFIGFTVLHLVAGADCKASCGTAP